MNDQRSRGHDMGDPPSPNSPAVFALHLFCESSAMALLIFGMFVAVAFGGWAL